MQTLEPLSAANVAPLGPDARESEFEVQASLFSALRANGFEVRGEVRWTAAKVPGQRRETCRFDLVIYEREAAIHIVEVKCAPIEHRCGVENTRQGRRYRHFGVPVTFIYGGGDALDFLQLMLGRRGI